LLRALLRRGYVAGQNLTYEARGAMGQARQLAQFFQDMRAKTVDAILCTGYPVALAAKIAGIPTVVAFCVCDPAATGLVPSLARPGGYILGISDVATPPSTKRMELLKEMARSLRRIAMLWNRDDRAMTQRSEGSARAAVALGVTVQALGVREPSDFDEAFA